MPDLEAVLTECFAELSKEYAVERVDYIPNKGERTKATVPVWKITLTANVFGRIEDIEAFMNQLYDLMEKLENVTGNTITYQSLSDGFRKVGYAQYELSEFIRLKKQMPYLRRKNMRMKKSLSHTGLCWERFQTKLVSFRDTLIL